MGKIKKILVTGSDGFIGKTLIEGLAGKFVEIYSYDLSHTREYLKNILVEVDFVFHCAGVNYPPKPEYFNDNWELTRFIVDCLLDRKVPIVLTSSTQADLDNFYGQSKLRAEKEILRYRQGGGIGYIYRLTNVFGRGCKPNYNSVVSTWCYNVVNGKEVIISDPDKKIDLIYIDDLIKDFIAIIEDNRSDCEILFIKPSYKIKLSELASLIKSFNDDFFKKLYHTYLQFQR